MSNKVIVKKQPILFNSIDEQRLSYANQLTVKSWNDIINILRVQTNTNTAYIKQLHNWLVGNTGEDITIPETDTSFVEYVLSGEQSLEKLDVKNLYVNGKEVAIKENVVDLTSAQTITGPKTFSSQIFFNNDAVLSSSTGVFRFGDSSNVGALAVLAGAGTNYYLRPGISDKFDLGNPDEYWKDLYISGNLTDGTHNVPIRDIVTTTTDQTITGAKRFAGIVGNVQTESGVYLGIDENVGAPNANIAITSANTAAYIDMGPPNKDYGFRLIKWNNLNGKYNAELCYGDDGSGQGIANITIPRATGTMALTSDIPPIDNSSGVQDIGWTHADMDTPRIATANRIAHWNGAYNNTNASNLKYGAGGELAFKSDIDNVMQVASGKTKTYVIDVADNPKFNSDYNYISLTKNDTLITIDGVVVDLDTLQKGDNILVINTTIPDRYFGGIHVSNQPQIIPDSYRFYMLETRKIDLDVKQDTLVSGENIKTIDGKSLLGNGNITTYNLIYSNAGPTDTVQAVITQIKKYLNIDNNEVHYEYVGHIRYTGYQEYLNGYINLRVTNGGTHIAIRYNDILKQKHCSVEGDYTGIANMSINNFLDAYLVHNRATKTSQLTNDSGFLTEHQDISGKADKTELEQYLPLSGAKAMTGNLEMKGNNIIFDNNKEDTLEIGEEDDGYSMSIRMEDTDYYKGRYRASGFSVGNDYIDATLDISESRFTMTFAGDSSSTITPDGFSVSKEGTTYYEDGRIGRYFDNYSKHVEIEIPKKSGKLALKEDIPTKVSQLDNDSGLITNAVDDLTNYYLKSETYTKSEVQQLLSTISSLKLEVVTNLPTTNISSNTIYLKPLDSAKENNIYEEYIYINNKWETIGTTAVDLTNYALKKDIPTKTSELTNDSNFLTEHQDISGKADKTELDNYLPLTGGTVIGNIKALEFTLPNGALISSYSGQNYKDIRILAIGPDDNTIKSGTIHMGTTLPRLGENSWGSTFTFDMANDALYSSAGNSLSLGLSDKQWWKVYGKQIYQDGKQVANKEDIPTKTSELTNDSNFLTEHQDISGYLPLSAGSDKPLIGDLYSNGTNISSGEIRLIAKNGIYRFGDSNASTSDASNILVFTYGYLRPGRLRMSLGTSDIPWGNVYGTTIYQDSKQVANKEDIPTKTSQLTNDSNFLTEHQDISGKVDRTELNDYETKGSTGATLDASIDNTTYVMTLKLCNSYGNIISTGTVDLPLETMVISARYADGKLYLTTKDGNELDGIDISNIVSGLVPNTRTVNGKALSSNITLNKADVGLGKVNNVAITSSQVSQITTNKNNIASLEARINALESAPRISGANYNDYY